jgi:hypothetical protein
LPFPRLDSCGEKERTPPYFSTDLKGVSDARLGLLVIGLWMFFVVRGVFMFSHG